MIIKIKDIYLYTGFTANANDGYSAKVWMDQNNIQYTHMHYADSAQHQSLFDALSTWSFGDAEIAFSQFPFVIYDEVSDDYSITKRCLYGLEAITSSDLVNLVAIGA